MLPAEPIHPAGAADELVLVSATTAVLGADARVRAEVDLAPVLERDDAGHAAAPGRIAPMSCCRDWNAASSTSFWRFVT